MSHSIKSLPFVLAGTLSLAVAACAQKPDDPRTGPPTVRVATVDSATQPTRNFSGIVSARVQSNLGFRVPGKVVERLVDTGQTVKKGDPLMRIDPTDLSLALTSLSGQVEAARAKALQAASDEKRFRGLVSAGAVSASAYDQAKAASDAAAAQLRAAEAQASVGKNEAGYSTLLADADGTVVQTLAEPGQVVTAGQNVVLLAHAGPREAVIDLPETIRPTIGSVATALVYGGEGKSGSAKLRQLSDSADLNTRTFEARYVLEGAAAEAPLGTTVTIKIPDGRAGSALQIPLAALFDVGKGPGVWVVDKKSTVVNWRAVQVTAIGEETATLSGGLSAGENFVALGAHLLHPGEQVRIAPQPDAQK